MKITIESTSEIAMLPSGQRARIWKGTKGATTVSFMVAAMEVTPPVAGDAMIVMGLHDLPDDEAGAMLLERRTVAHVR